MNYKLSMSLFNTTIKYKAFHPSMKEHMNLRAVVPDNSMQYYQLGKHTNQNRCTMMQAMLIRKNLYHIFEMVTNHQTLSYSIQTRLTNADDIPAKLPTSLKSPLDTTHTYLMLKRLAVKSVFRTCSLFANVCCIHYSMTSVSLKLMHDNE